MESYLLRVPQPFLMMITLLGYFLLHSYLDAESNLQSRYMHGSQSPDLADKVFRPRMHLWDILQIADTFLDKRCFVLMLKPPIISIYIHALMVLEY